MISLEEMARRLENQPARPPIAQWQPDLSGDIDIRIDRDGQWIHEGQAIRRPALVALFASILRRDADGEYYLVTPVEKWRLRVDDTPLIVTDLDVAGEGRERRLIANLNTGVDLPVDGDHPLVMRERQGDLRPEVELEHGLSAKLARPVYYRLMETAQWRGEEPGLYSFGLWFSLR